MNLYKQFTVKPYFFLVINTTLASNNPFHFKKNLLERIQKLNITIDDIIRDKNCNMKLREKQQKYQHYHQVKLIKMNILQMKKYYLLIKGE